MRISLASGTVPSSPHITKFLWRLQQTGISLGYAPSLIALPRHDRTFSKIRRDLITRTPRYRDMITELL
ncbi:hypothetical protein RB195_005839 [Necator americanus]|uniref:Uncharacterized protein n=1 Tax=Necator americanus TaxID=51031 RepID=A0ABR1BRP1_NECAM